MIAKIEDAERLENSSGRWPVLEFDSLGVCPNYSVIPHLVVFFLFSFLFDRDFCINIVVPFN
jgi:hypothetical protein